jgi:hypothetical protein
MIVSQKQTFDHVSLMIEESQIFWTQQSYVVKFMLSRDKLLFNSETVNLLLLKVPEFEIISSHILLMKPRPSLNLI